MRRYLIIISLVFLCSLIGADVLAQPPIINYNVPVLFNVGPSQCPGSWRGSGQQQNVVRYGWDQTNTSSGPTVRSCTGCAYNSSAQSCICATCYDYYQ